MTTPRTLAAALVWLLAGGVVLGLVAALAGGASALASVGVGIGLLVAFVLFGAVSLRATAAAPPVLTLMIALLTYALQVLLLGLTFVALRRSGLLEDTLDRQWLGVTVILGTVAASGLLVWLVHRSGTVAHSLTTAHYHSSEQASTEQGEGRSGGGTGG